MPCTMRSVLLALVLVLPVASRAHTAEVAELYRGRCAVCHGIEGRGDGPAAPLLTPRPRDFTAGVYKWRSTPSGTLPTEDDVVRIITRGLPRGSMPGFEDLLSPDERRALARYVLDLAPAGRRPGAPIVLPRVDWGVRLTTRGAQLYERAGCPACHGADGRGAGWRPAREGPAAEAEPADLSQPWSFGGGAQIDDIALRILTGLDGSAMPAHAGRVRPDEALAIAGHVLTLARTPLWRERDPARIRTTGVQSEPLARGRYLTKAMLCPLCHTPISDVDGAYDARLFLAGGMRVTAYPWGVWYSRNLTPDADTGLGRWSEAEITAAITAGRSRDGRRLDPMAMPWPWFSRLTPDDARAIAVYLKTLPAVRNEVPPPYRPWWPEQVGGKLLALAGGDHAVAFWGGNAAVEPSRRQGAGVTRGHRLTAWLLGGVSLGLGLALLVVGRLSRGGGRRATLTAAGAAVTLAWMALAVWPPLWLMTPGQATGWLFRGAPSIPAWIVGPDRALAERGEYLASIAPCGLCHTPVSAFVGFLTSRTLAGGMDARWRVYGRAVATNLTPHRDGIAAASVPALTRALRSGIGVDGRAMHWQAMPWDIFSHWSEEDRLAMMAYLRALPPVAGRMPPPRPPRADDPDADSFYFGDAAARGSAR